MFARRKTRRFRSLANPSLWVLAMLAGMLSLSGCGLRLDTPPDPLPSLDSGQAGISAVTRAQEAISSGADALASDASQSIATRQAAGVVRDQAAQRLSVMGGVWNPWPSGVPSGAEPGPTPSPVPGTVGDLLQMLVDSGETARRAASGAPNQVDAILLAATSVASDLDANRLSVASGVPVVPNSAKVTAEPQTNPDEVTEKIEDTRILEKLRKSESALDFARYRAETAAAFLSGDDRAWALRRAETLSWEVQQLVSLGVEDVRAGQYALDFETISDRASAIRLLNSADADAFAAQLDVVGLIPPTDKNTPQRRDSWIGAARSSAFSQARFGVPPSTIFSQLWP